MEGVTEGVKDEMRKTTVRLHKCEDMATRLPKVAPAMDLKRLLGEGADGVAGRPVDEALAEVLSLFNMIIIWTPLYGPVYMDLFRIVYGSTLR